MVLTPLPGSAGIGCPLSQRSRKASSFTPIRDEPKFDALIASLKQEMHSKEITISQFQERLKIEFVNQILFGNGSTRITPTGEKVLSQVGAILKDLKENYVFVVGHTDDVPIGPDLLGFFGSNWELSAARSASVVRYLVEKAGVGPERCIVVGRSYHSPLGANDTSEGRSQNRRAEIIISKSLELLAPPLSSPEETPSGAR